MVKNIIFDFGGVVLNIDYQLTVAAFSKIGLKEFDKGYSQALQSSLFDDFEMGKVAPSEFRDLIRKKINHSISDDEIDKAWNAMLLDLPEGRVQLLEKLKKDNRLFLLSNTNIIHEKAFNEMILKQYGTNILEHVFDKVYLSHRLGLRKPNKEIFELVLKENDLVAGETLFIDDSPQHIEGARAAGVNAMLLIKNKTILDLFKD